MKARMKDNLVPRYMALVPDVVDEPDEDVINLLSRIEGKEVELVFVHGDAFEKTDNNIWLPDCMWEEM